MASKQSIKIVHYCARAESEKLLASIKFASEPKVIKVNCTC